MNIRRLNRVSAFLLGLALAACDGNVLGPDNQLEVGNNQDQFQFQVTALTDVTDSRSYQWENTGAQATIDVSQSITSGSAFLTIRDAAGAVMYQEDLADDSDGSTPNGEAGTWTIEVRIDSATGDFNFRVQKTT